ncbi:hypothetical protein ABZ540_35930 [Nocardia xishanensis]|uniref:hypothetical protein n=1 Tax=Nocardia xishanensis TaxID=238964 RepID=UPI00340314DD
MRGCEQPQDLPGAVLHWHSELGGQPFAEPPPLRGEAALVACRDSDHVSATRPTGIAEQIPHIVGGTPRQQGFGGHVAPERILSVDIRSKHTVSQTAARACSFTRGDGGTRSLQAGYWCPVVGFVDHHELGLKQHAL